MKTQVSANKWFLPLVWATDICARALAEGHIRPQVIVIMITTMVFITTMMVVITTLVVITSSPDDLVSPDDPSSGGRDCHNS